jgi:hypothetical protein
MQLWSFWHSLRILCHRARAWRRLDFDEFHDQLWYTLHEWEHPNAEPQSDDHVVSQARFHELDVNKCAPVSSAQSLAHHAVLHVHKLTTVPQLQAER